MLRRIGREQRRTDNYKTPQAGKLPQLGASCVAWVTGGGDGVVRTFRSAFRRPSAIASLRILGAFPQV